MLTAILLLGNMASMTAMADYQDPLDSPALIKTAAAQSLLLDVARAGGRLLVAIGERGHILISDDQGQSWTQRPSPVRAHLTAVYFVDADNGWIVGADGLILYSGDGGISWTKQFDDRDADLRGPLLDVYFSNPSNGFAVGVYNKLYLTHDGGKSWQIAQDRVENPDEWHLISIAVSDDKFYVTSEMGLLFVSEDGGESFSPLQTDHTGTFHGILSRENVDGTDQLVLFGVGGKLFTTLDDGESWIEIDTGTTAGLFGGTWLADGGVMLVGADGVLLRGNADLSQWRTEFTDNSLPLTSVIELNNKKILTGIGGTQIIE
ncbi:MAG: hypothetical protein KZQ78_10210 [Candidatus Thiodiazotropha sp. (ex Ustalcina ferruginea)]|nr:hypothetical protein [Candidatus Thiodiazotropha sp. (ex Ustalcina ferruginea)]